MSWAKNLYQTEVKSKLKDALKLKNIHEVPALEKIVLNMCVKEAVADSKKIQGAVDDLMLIAGQKPIITKAKKSIAGFKLREGVNLGAKVTLRGDRMYAFFDHLINIALPRVRDFRGLSKKSFDKRGNYSLGIKEQIIFPQINYDKVDKVRGLDVTICTTTNNDAHAAELLKAMHLPIQG